MSRCLFTRRFSAFFLFFLTATFVQLDAAELSENFTGNLKPDWIMDKSAKSAGSIGVTPEGLLLQAEPRQYGLIKRDCEAAGSDAAPLSISVQIKTQHGAEGPTLPGLVVYWDEKNSAYVKLSGDGSMYFGSMLDGVVRDQALWNIAREGKTTENKKWRESYVRVVLVSRNIAYYVGSDGKNWQKVAESGRRPGPAGKAPKIILGRGWPGDGKDRKPDLANDYYADGNKTLIKTLFNAFQLTDKVEPPGAASTLIKQDTWEQTTASLEGAGIPRAWSFLGPVPLKGAEKKALAPDLSDDWSAPKDGGGLPIKATSWVRPDDDADCYVDLSEHVGQSSNSIGWAKSEIDWPVEGEALLWFSSGDQITVYVNNNAVYTDADDPQDRRAVKDRACIPVALNKGKNVIKTRIRQTKGDWGFFLRLERNDAGYRIRLLEKLLEYFPEWASNWRAINAHHEIARRLEDMGNYPAAIATSEKSMTLFALDDENRLRAFENKLRLLEFLRDYEGLIKTGEAHAAAYPRAIGSDSALRAILRGEVMAGRAEAAIHRVKQWPAGTMPIKVADAYRIVAGAFEDGDKDEKLCQTLDQLADNGSMDVTDRVRAATESALRRWETQRRKAAANQPLDNAVLAAGCASSAKALSLLKSNAVPMAAKLAQEAENDLKAGKGERASAGYWGALLLAIAGTDPETAAHLRFNGANGVDIPKDKDNKEFVDAAQFKKALWKKVAASVNEPKWEGKWRFVGFPLEGNATIRTPFGPESDSNKADYGNNRKWTDVDMGQENDADPYRGNHDWGIDLNPLKGNSHVGYIVRDFEVAAAGETSLWLSTMSSWFAWLDGKPVGENANTTGFKFEVDRVKLQLTPGKHRLLLKLEAPPEGPFVFRARIGNEPEMAMHLLVQALTVRQFPRTVLDRRGELHWLMHFTWGKTSPDVPLKIADTISQLYAENTTARLEPMNWILEQLRNSGDLAIATQELSSLIGRIENGGWYAEKKRHVCDLYMRYFFIRVGEGRAAAADALLRDICNRYPEMTDLYFQALTLRGNLRRDFAQSQAAQPFFEEVLREHPMAWKSQRGAVLGLEWARSYRPERLLLDTSHEVQSVLDAIRRQLGAGAADDIEKAMRNVSDVLMSSPGALNKVVDSPYFSRYVGVREYIRALLGSLPENNRDVYRKVVEGAAARRLKVASEMNDAAALEVLANEFYFTPAAIAARNRAGNLYLERGQFARAASVFQVLQREVRTGESPSAAMLTAKLAKALSADGQTAAAERALERLKTQYGNEPVAYGGEKIKGAALAEKLKNVFAANKPATVVEETAPTATHMGGLLRTGSTKGPATEAGPVVWAHPLIPNAALERTRGAFELDVRAHLPAYPVVAEGKVFVSGPESIRAIDQNSGAILWTKTWPYGQPLFKNVFNGYPISCPTVSSGKVYMRAVESGASSLRSYAADSGKLRWHTGGISELKKVAWISDPAISYGLAIAMYVEPGDMNTHGIAALDAETGRLRWKTSLVTGNTGIKTNDQFQLSTLHMGPPAIDGGEIYVNTGLSSVAAINAFSGEIKWVATYPKIQFGDRRSGHSHAGYDLRMCTVKTLSRGPLSPLLVDDLVIVVPKDGTGVLAFERQGGALRWKKEFVDARFIGGIADGNILLCDDTVTALNLTTGAIAWQYSLQEQSLYGQPALSGGQLYLSCDRELRRLDAKSGVLLGSSPWDNRVGPMANLVVTPTGLVGIGEGTIVALGASSEKAASLPLFEARELEAKGKLDAAAELYGSLLNSKDSSEVLQALIARTRILQRLGKRDEALAALTKIEQESSEQLKSFNGLWQVKKDVFARALRSRLGEKTPDAPAPEGDLNSVLVYSWQMPGENPRLIYPATGAQDCVFVHNGSDIACVRLGGTPDEQWRSYVGPAVQRVLIGPTAVVAVSDFRIIVLDRATGEMLSEITPPVLDKKGPRRLETKPFEDAAINDTTLATVSDMSLVAWDLPTGQIQWFKRLGWHHRPVLGGLSISGGKVMKVQGVKNDKQNDNGLFTFDVKTGNEMENLTLGGRAGSMFASYSPDQRRVLYRSDNNLICADAGQLKKIWQVNLPRLELRGGPFFHDGEVIRYMGPENGNGRWIVIWMNPETGKELPVNWIFPDGRKENRSRIGAKAFRVNGECIVFSGDWDRTMSRMKVSNDKVDGVYTIDLPDYQWREHWLLGAFSGKDRYHVAYVRSRNNQDQFILRTFTWDGGQVIGEQILPGTPVRQEDNTFAGNFIQRGNMLLYTAREGVFAFAAGGETIPKVAEKLKQELDGDAPNSQRRRDARRALMNIDATAAMAFLAPKDIRIEGGLNEWQHIEPVLLEGALNYVPLVDGAKWNGKDDLSAKLYVGWNQEGLAVALDVTDDVMSPPLAGAELSSGDSLRVIIDSQPDYGSALDRNEDFVGSLALVSGRPVLDQELGTSDDPGDAAQGHVMRSPNGKGYRYEMMIPWPLLRKDPNQRPGWLRQLRIGVAVYDDDGSGARGAMELGAGTTSASCVTPWLSPLTLLDVSHEKIERYRKVIDLVPGSDEAMRFLELILLSKRGVNANAERIAELERFITAHPNTPNTPRAVGLLRPLYQKASDAPPEGKLNEFMKAAKVPDGIQQLVAGSAIKVWAYVDPKNSAQMIMLQFQRGDGQYARSYWGASAIDWGRNGTTERMYLGPIPKAGQWTELVVYPSDFGILGHDLKMIAFTTFGGNTFFDRLSVRVKGVEKVLIDDALFDKAQVEQGRIKFVDNPKHDGGKSFTFERNNPNEMLLNAMIHTQDWKPMVTFTADELKPTELKDPAKYQALCRGVAQLIQDTPEGLTFFQRVLDLHNDEGKKRDVKCIDEIKTFLKANPGTPNAGHLLKLLYAWYKNASEKEPRARCEELMQELKVARDVKRAFYNEYAPVWSEWNVLGPFAAQGERRGLDTLMEPEKAVDLKWKTIDASQKEIGWKKISNLLDDKKKPNNDPVVDLRRHLQIPRAIEQKGPVFGYAYVKFNVPSKRRGLLLFGAKDMVSMWLNGKRVVSELESIEQKDKDSIEVNLRSGENEVLIKVGCQKDQRLGFVFRLADTDGKPFPDVTNE